MLISVTLFVFHFEISGNNDNLLHLLNIKPISHTLLVSNFEISDNSVKEKYSHNIFLN